LLRVVAVMLFALALAGCGGSSGSSAGSAATAAAVTGAGSATGAITAASIPVSTLSQPVATAGAVGTLQFSSSTYSVEQSAGTVAVTVNRTGGTSGAVSVAYATTNGTAVAGTNYTATSGTLQWADGDAQPQSFSVPVSTTAFSGSKALTVTLSGAVSASLGTPSSATVSIAGSAAASTSGQFGIKVSGNTLVSTVDGSTVELIGTNASGLENGQSESYWTPYANSTLAFWQSLKNYQGSGINAVRLPLNSAYWLGYACGFSASTYQSTVEHVVSMATEAGLYVILDLHWDAPNSICPTGQGGFATAHATAFWTSIADTFKGNPAVIYELFNEPFGDNNSSQWQTYVGSTPAVGSDGTYLANGGNYPTFLAQNNIGGGGFITTNITYPVAGEIQLIQTIRNEGATNVILASPMGWSGYIETWLSTYTTGGNPDPLKQLAASWHVYGYSMGTSYAQALLAAGYPIVITETYGFDAKLDGGTGTAAGYAWARSNNIGYMCWGTLNDWSGQTSLSLASTPPWALCTPQ
jgi:endoglucanase